jgi:hypothetical protein
VAERGRAKLLREVDGDIASSWSFIKTEKPK